METTFAEKKVQMDSECTFGGQIGFELVIITARSSQVMVVYPYRRPHHDLPEPSANAHEFQVCKVVQAEASVVTLSVLHLIVHSRRKIPRGMFLKS